MEGMLSGLLLLKKVGLETTFYQRGREIKIKGVKMSWYDRKSLETTFYQRGREIEALQVVLDMRGSGSLETTFYQRGREIFEGAMVGWHTLQCLETTFYQRGREIQM